MSDRDSVSKTSAEVSFSETTVLEIPVARKIPTRRTLHGIALEDDYAWLRDRESREVHEYLEAENRHTDAVMAPTLELQEILYQEMLGRIQEDDVSVPVADGPYLYYARNRTGHQYPIYCRRLGEAGEEEVLLDLNQLAESHDYLKLGVFRVSPDHKLLAYSLDLDGSERFTLHVRDLDGGTLLDDVIENTARSLVWTNDSASFYYTVLDEQRRPHAAWHHRLGEPAGDDSPLFEEEDGRFFMGLGKTRSRRFLILELGSHTTTEVHTLDLESPGAELRCFAPRKQGVELTLAHHDRHFYVLTNEHARNFRLVRVPVDDPDPAGWEEILPHRETVKLESLDVFERHLALYLRQDGLRTIQILTFEDGSWHTVEQRESVHAVWPQENRNFGSSVLRFLYTSLVTPRSIYDYDMDRRERTLLKRYQVLGNFDSNDYVSERRHATAADGTRIPVSVVYRKGTPLGAETPALLYGYGSYGNCIEPYFSSLRLSLLDRGFVYAIAHIRGGGEMGRVWYDEGKLEHKQNTFGDFAAVAEMLEREGLTHRKRLAIRGGSAGGLLVGAVLNQRPELCAAAIAEVPFVDVLNTMLDPSLPLTVIEYEEWGNPEEPEAFDTIRAYSPYDNVAAIDYPHLLVTAGLNDPRVQYWEPAKWVAKLRDVAIADHTLLLRTDMSSGHGGASGRYDALREEAFKMAFLISVLGLAGAPELARPSSW